MSLEVSSNSAQMPLDHPSELITLLTDPNQSGLQRKTL